MGIEATLVEFSGRCTLHAVFFSYDGWRTHLIGLLKRCYQGVEKLCQREATTIFIETYGSARIQALALSNTGGGWRGVDDPNLVPVLEYSYNIAIILEVKQQGSSMLKLAYPCQGYVVVVVVFNV